MFAYPARAVISLCECVCMCVHRWEQRPWVFKNASADGETRREYTCPRSHAPPPQKVAHNAVRQGSIFSTHFFPSTFAFTLKPLYLTVDRGMR